MLFVLAGVVFGVIGFAPLYFAFTRAQQAARASIVIVGLGCVLVSFAIMVASLLVVRHLAAESLVPYAIALLVTFIVCIVVSTIVIVLRRAK